MKKRWIVLLLGLLLIVAACSSGDSDVEDATKSTDNGGGKTYTMRVGHALNSESPRHQILEEFKKIVEDKTDNNVEVKLFHSDQAGDNNELIQAVPLGNIEAAINPVGFFGGVESRLSVVDFPFIWKDMDHVGEILSSETGERILSTLEDHNMKGLAFWPIGMKVISSNKSIQSLDDFKGQKFYSTGTPVLVDIYKAWGSNPIVMTVGELYSSLQQGVLDGQENDFGFFHDLSLYEVQEYILPTHHGPITDVFYVNLDWFEQLPEEYQSILKDTATELITDRIKLGQDIEEGKVDVIKDTGKTTILDVPQDLERELKELTEPIKKEFSEKYPDMADILKEIEQ